MLLTLTATCLRPLLLPASKGKRPKMELTDLPAFTRETLGLTGLNLSTDLLVGADRARLEAIRERSDKSSCACLLLVEADPQHFGAVDETAGKAAMARMLRVVEAAQILGCSSAAVRLDADDTEPSLVRVAARLKPVVERAEKLDINLLISPHKGLTYAPERLAELIKKVGGFRIGTFPDFEAAAAQKDSTSYLRRLTPYASVVCASTVKFGPPRKVKIESAQTLPDLDDEEIEDDLGVGEKSDAIEVERADHESYSLKPLVSAIASVGYDGTLAVDYRGGGDVTMGVIYSRNALQDALDEVSAEA